jgi:hypothetical protein
MRDNTKAVPSSRHPGKWHSLYRGRDGSWTRANNALGQSILCDSDALAHSVARYRCRRLQRFR